MTPGHRYDIAVSFSGTHRPYVERVVQASEDLGLRVFYDKKFTVQLWGKNVITEFRNTYRVEARYFVAFLSREYFAGAYPMDEFRTAILRAIEQEDYILPVLMDDVEVPSQFLNPATIYLRAADYEPEDLARIILARVGLTGDRSSVPTTPQRSGDAARRPRLTPSQFSSQDVLDQALRYVGSRFQQEAPTLEEYGFHCRVHARDVVSVLVEERGGPVCELKVAPGEPIWSESLTMSFAWPRIVVAGVNGQITAHWDADVGEPRLKLRDYSLTGAGIEDQLLTAEELFQRLWEKVVRHLEQVK